jgi:hypothetical protein
VAISIATVHPVPRLARPVYAVATAFCVLLAVSGCGTTDLARKTFPRSTVPMTADNAADSTGTGTATSGQAADAAFAIDKLRLVDPCKVLEGVADLVGRPSDYNASGFSECSNYVQDEHGEDLSISVRLGQSMTLEVQKADKQIAGMRAYEQKLDSNACFVNIITQENPGLGLTVQIGAKDGDPCAPGRTVAEGVVKQIKQKAPTRTPAKGSLLGLDPCALPDEAAVTDAVGSAPRRFPYGMHTCSWSTAAADIGIDLRSSFIPKDDKFDDKQQSVDLGGVPAFQILNAGAHPTCTLKWVQRGTSGNEGEIVEVKSSGSKSSDFDRCAKAQAFAKALLPKIPRA